MFFKSYWTNTAGENKITAGEQSSFSHLLPAKFSVSLVKNRCLSNHSDLYQISETQSFEPQPHQFDIKELEKPKRLPNVLCILCATNQSL